MYYNNIYYIEYNIIIMLKDAKIDCGSEELRLVAVAVFKNCTGYLMVMPVMVHTHFEYYNKYIYRVIYHPYLLPFFLY